ncbi:MAG: hypothetical protein ACSHX8_07190 [Opitutaceae bacterium]
MSKDIYHFEPVIENGGGFQINQRVCAVYKLAGFIHKTYRNAAGVEPGTPVWIYVERGGKLTGIDSTDSAEAVQEQLGGTAKSNATSTQTVGHLHRMFIGLHRQGGEPVDHEIILKLLATRLDTFTVTETIGYYKGEREPTLIVEVAKTNGADLIPLAKDIADAFDQDAVGVESKGIYTRVFGERRDTSALTKKRS